MTTRVINIHASKEHADVYIGRSKKGDVGLFGNPFVIGKDGDRELCLKRFRYYFYERLKFDRQFKAKVEELRGKVLGCFCAPQPCHGDIIIEYLDGPKPSEQAPVG